MSRNVSTFSLVLLLALAVGCGGQPASNAPAADAPTADAPTADTPTADAPAPKTDNGDSASAGDDPCSSLSVAEAAAIFGGDAANIEQAAGDAASRSNGKSRDCNTTITHEGVETTVTLLVRAKGENMGPDGLSQRIQSLLQDGEKVGSQNYVYEPFAHGAVEGALSDVHGGAYVRLRSLQWQADEAHHFRLIVATTIVGDVEGDPPTPSPELFGQLVDAVIN
ncbi:MAG: hypothetical protein AAF560_30465 [Acidobacteriota bacterium]